jgi:hypothetical protein
MFLFTAMLIFVWQFSKEAFSIYMSLPPLSRERPVSDKSKNPSGTLLTGLQAADRPFTRTMAFMELDLISREFKPRRVGIYSDIQYQPTMWDSVCGECLEVIGKVTAHARQYTRPTTSNKTMKPSSIGGLSIVQNNGHQVSDLKNKRPEPILRFDTMMGNIYNLDFICGKSWLCLC